MSEFVKDHVEKFESEMTRCEQLAVSTENLRWVIYSVGDTEIEQAVIDKIAASMDHLEGVFIFGKPDPQTTIEHLEDAIAELKARLNEEVKANLEGDEYTVTYGTTDG